VASITLIPKAHGKKENYKSMWLGLTHCLISKSTAQLMQIKQHGTGTKTSIEIIGQSRGLRSKPVHLQSRTYFGERTVSLRNQVGTAGHPCRRKKLNAYIPSQIKVNEKWTKDFNIMCKDMGQNTLSSVLAIIF
jgi:hypothetical protein